MKQISDIFNNAYAKTTPRLQSNPFCISIDNGVDCFGCHKAFTSSKLLQCSEANCKRAFCYQCLSPKDYNGLLTYEYFEKMVYSHNWKCPCCSPKSTEEMALGEPEVNNFLSKKRHRIIYRLKLNHLIKRNKPKINSNAQIIHNTIIKMIYHSIKKIDKIKEPESIMKKSKRKQSDQEMIEDVGENKTKAIDNRTIQKKTLLSTKKPKEKVNLDINFPNFEFNKQINALIIKSAVVSHSCRVHKGIKKGKPCVFCDQDDCPNGIEMVKFKKYEDLVCFFNIFFSEIELYISKESDTDVEFCKKILKEKEYLFELQDNIGGLRRTLLNEVKTFCSNCIANAFRQNVGVSSILNCFNNIEENDHQVFNPLKKLENQRDRKALFCLNNEKMSLPKGEIQAKDCNDNKQQQNDRLNVINSYHQLCKSSETALESNFSDINNIYNNKKQFPTLQVNLSPNQKRMYNLNENYAQINNYTINKKKENYSFTNNNYDNNEDKNNNKNDEKLNNIMQRKNSQLSSSNDKLFFLRKQSNNYLIPEKEHNFVINSTLTQKNSGYEEKEAFVEINKNVTGKNELLMFLIGSNVDYFPFPIQLPQPNHPIGINTFTMPHKITHMHTVSPVAPLIYKDLSLLMLHNFYSSLYDKYITPLDNITLFESNQLKNMNNLTNLIDQTQDRDLKSLSDQMMYELSILNNKAKEKAEIISTYALELNELHKYFGYLFELNKFH